MHLLIRTILWAFFTIFVLTAVLSLSGVSYLWLEGSRLNPPMKNLPYLHWLLLLTIAEIAGLTILVARKGLSYLPVTEVNKNSEKTEQFMYQFLRSGSSATLVSNRLSWVTASKRAQKCIIELAEKNTLIEIITPQPIQDEVKKTLTEAGVRFYVTCEDTPPEARFTLINANRSGSEKLAIARGIHPDHEITIFDTNSGPQIIAMAKDIVTKAKRISHAKQVE